MSPVCFEPSCWKGILENPPSLSANNQSSDRSWLASFHLNNCWNPSNQASWPRRSWKASPQQASASFELQELQLLVRARVSLMTALPLTLKNSLQKNYIKHRSIEKKLHLTNVVWKLGFYLTRVCMRACMPVCVCVVSWQGIRIKAWV